MRWSWFFAGFAAAMLATAAGSLTGMAADDRGLIAAARAAQNSAIAAGDLDRVATFWTDDVTVRRGLGAQVAGRAAALDALRPDGAPASRIV